MTESRSALTRSHPQPRVTIGLPVFNGEECLAQSLTALLEQSFQDFRLVISDNASTDRTALIATEIAASDPRVEYRRNDRNIGALANFNQLLLGCHTEYFMWAAHDDHWDTEFLKSCVIALDAQPEAVLATPSFKFVWPQGEPPRNHTVRQELNSRHIGQRLQFAIADWGWMAIYGLMRLEKLRSSPPLLPFLYSDVFFVADCARRGPFATVTTDLFSYRLSASPGEFSAANIAHSLGPDVPYTSPYPATALFGAIVKATWNSPLSLPSRVGALMGVWRAGRFSSTMFFSWNSILLSEWSAALIRAAKQRQISRVLFLGVAVLTLRPRLAVSRSAWSKTAKSLKELVWR